MNSTLFDSEPQSGVLPDFIFPEVQTKQLSATLIAHSIYDETSPLSTISVLAKQGSRNEPTAGIAQFVAGMLPRGTSTKSALEIAEIIDAHGASFSSSSRWDSFGISTTCLNEHAQTMVALLLDCLLNPAFDDSEIERQRQNMVSELHFNFSEPEYLAARSLAQVSFKGDAYAHNREGTLESLSTITAQHCKEFHTSILAHAEWIVVLSGGADAEEILKQVQEKSSLFGLHIINEKNSSFNTPSATAFVDIPDAPQVNLSISISVPPMGTTEHFAANVLATELGGYFRSRLNLLLREQYGYTYGAYAYIDSRRNASRLVIGVPVGTESTGHSLQIIKEQLHMLASEEFNAEQLEILQTYIIGSFVRTTETAQQKGSLLSQVLLSNTTPEHYTNYIHFVKSLTTKSLLEFQQRCLHLDSICIGASGPKDVVQKVLSQIAEPQEFSAETV